MPATVMLSPTKLNADGWPENGQVASSTVCALAGLSFASATFDATAPMKASAMMGRFSNATPGLGLCIGAAATSRAAEPYETASNGSE